MLFAERLRARLRLRSIICSCCRLGRHYAIQLCLLIPAYLWIVYKLVLRAWRGEVAARYHGGSGDAVWDERTAIDFAIAYMSRARDGLKHSLKYPKPLIRSPYSLEQADAVLYWLHFVDT